MAKKGRIKYRTRTVYKRVKSGAKGFFTGVPGKLLAGALYGGIRERASDMLAPATAKIPAGEISDEVGMLALNWILSRSLPPAMKPAARAGMIIEAARIGEFIADKGLAGLQVGGQQQQTQITGAIF